ncbi:hypothetical protein VCHA53O466_40256 [Vibrio chagasii]|nr:hypothetical protein VCHA53O466_40256 [Vibrio chagasii]
MSSVAKRVFDYCNEVGHIVMPMDVKGVFTTVNLAGRPYFNAIVFKDGSELVLGFDGSFFWSEAGEHDMSKLSVGDLSNETRT